MVIFNLHITVSKVQHLQNDPDFLLVCFKSDHCVTCLKISCVNLKLLLNQLPQSFLFFYCQHFVTLQAKDLQIHLFTPGVMNVDDERRSR